MTKVLALPQVVSIALSFFCISAASAADGQIIITDAKARAGNVTPGDRPNYPVTLTLPGSYVLGGNLSPGPGRDGIVAATRDISIDLNGFTISGGPAGGTRNARYGINDLGDRLTVKNGTLGGFRGVSVGSSAAGIYAPDRPFLIVENMRIIHSTYGIDNGNGNLARIKNNTIALNTNFGILCGDSCHVEGNVVSSNGGYGIRVTRGTVLGNTVFSNASFGVTSVFTMGLGNNTIIDNNNGSDQTDGGRIQLFPNACWPGTC